MSLRVGGTVIICATRSRRATSSARPRPSCVVAARPNASHEVPGGPRNDVLVHFQPNRASGCAAPRRHAEKRPSDVPIPESGGSPRLSSEAADDRISVLSFVSHDRTLAPMITGFHTILYSVDPDATRAFFRDVLSWPWVDARGGWLIFKTPPSEIGCIRPRSRPPTAGQTCRTTRLR